MDKGDGSLRPVWDYRLLNDKPELDLYNLPHLRDFQPLIAGSKLFSKVDLRKAFHLICIDKRDQHKTCVATQWGMFNFKRLSMGMRNSAKAFQRLVDSVLNGLEGTFCYLDDILIFSKDKKTHLETLDKLFSRLAKAGLTVATSKCKFGQESLEYLGYVVSHEGISPMPRKVAALQNFPAPTKQKELLGFLGAINYYRASLPNLPDESGTGMKSPADILDPLYKLATYPLKKKEDFKVIWEKNQNIQESFKNAKLLLTKAVTLNHPVPSAPLALSTDASKTHLGATLDQWVDGAWKPSGFWSKALQPQQQRYTTFIRELLAIKHALRHFINEVNGRRLLIITDHRPITHSWKSQELQVHDPIAMNAINEIAQHTNEIYHKPGKDLIMPDLLSRPFPWAKNHTLVQTVDDLLDAPDYVAPAQTMAALEAVALHTISPESIAEGQKSCKDVKAHKDGLVPKGVLMEERDILGVPLYCEVSDPHNPRPLLPSALRSTVLNLLHHQDHPGQKETLRRASTNYYWPCIRANVESFVKTCHPCQLAKQSGTVNPSDAIGGQKILTFGVL